MVMMGMGGNSNRNNNNNNSGSGSNGNDSGDDGGNSDNDNDGDGDNSINHGKITSELQTITGLNLLEMVKPPWRDAHLWQRSQFMHMASAVSP